MRYLILYMRFILIYLRSKTEYGIYYLMDVVINFFGAFISVFTVWIILNKFQLINGWNFYQILLLYTINFFSGSLCGSIMRNPMNEQESLVREGGFDSVMTKPVHPLTYMIVRQFSHGHFFQACFSLGLFYISFKHLNISWTLLKVMWFVVIVFSATVLHAGIQLFIGALNFWFLRVADILDALTDEFGNFIRYPIIIYTKGIQVILTFVIPLGFINFYPVQYFLDMKDQYIFHPVFVYISPLVAGVVFITALKLWNIGLNRYHSTGS